MKTSESIKEIAGALIKAQAKIGVAVKDSTNPHFKSSYADLESVINAVKGPLNECGIAIVQAVSEAENGVAVETMFLHTSGEYLSETLTVPVVKHDAQGVGSAITYGKRYGLQAMGVVPSADDDGNAAAKAGEVKKLDGTTRPAKLTLDRATCPKDLEPDEFEKVKETVKATLGWLAEGSVADAVLTYENANFITEQQAYFWLFFDSKQRSAMSAEHDRLRKQHKEAA